MDVPQIITDLLDENNNFKDEINILKKKMQEISIKIGKELLVSDDKFRKYFEDVCSAFEEYGNKGMFRNYLDTEKKKYLQDLSEKLKMDYYEIVANMLKDKYSLIKYLMIKYQHNIFLRIVKKTIIAVLDVR